MTRLRSVPLVLGRVVVGLALGIVAIGVAAGVAISLAAAVPSPVVFLGAGGLVLVGGLSATAWLATVRAGLAVGTRRAVIIVTADPSMSIDIWGTAMSSGMAGLMP